MVDPVRGHRGQASQWAGLGKRAGYALFLVAIVLFLLAMLTEFSGLLAVSVIACLVLGSIVLAPAIVVGYGVKAAEREDRERGV